jgi:xylulokinase
VRRAAAQLAAAGHPLDAVRAVGLSGQTHGLVLVDERFAPVRPCLTWADQRAVAETRALARQVGAVVRERCANQVLEAFTLPKALWLARREPDALAAARHLGMPKDYLRHRLTGGWGTDHSDAASTLLYDLRTRDWDDELWEVAGLDDGLRPEICSSADVVGTVTAAAAAETGLPVGVPVTAGASDVACAALGAGVDELGVTYVNLGTAAQLMTPVRDPLAGVAHTFRGAGREELLAMTSVYSAGRSLEWFVESLCQGPAGRWTSDGGDRHRRIAEAVATVPPGANGLLFGASTPWFDADARAALLGLTAAHGQPDALRAVIEGVALAIRLALDELVARDAAVDHVRLGGGPSRSPAWSRIVADVCEARVEVLEGDASALGAGMLAGIGAGAFTDAAAAIEACVAVRDVVEPDDDAVAVYRRHAELFRQAYDGLAPVFEALGRPAPTAAPA